MVAMFGLLVVPLGAVSIFFIIIQPIVIGTWCTLCLIAAAAMVIMIPYSLDELVAMGQFLKARMRAGKPFWPTFWHGDMMEGGAEDKVKEFTGSPLGVVKEIFTGGVTFPWTLLVAAAIGVSLMFTRLTFGTEGSMANSDHLVGSLVVTFTVAAFAEVARPVRFINFAFGLWLIIAPWLLEGASSTAAWASVIAGLLLIALSVPRGTIRQRYGDWGKLIV
jgi:SPW repeat